MYRDVVAWRDDTDEKLLHNNVRFAMFFDLRDVVKAEADVPLVAKERETISVVWTCKLWSYFGPVLLYKVMESVVCSIGVHREVFATIRYDTVD